MWASSVGPVGEERAPLKEAAERLVVKARKVGLLAAARAMLCDSSLPPVEGALTIRYAGTLPPRSELLRRMRLWDHTGRESGILSPRSMVGKQRAWMTRRMMLFRRLDLRRTACRALKAILTPLEGRSMHDPANGLLRIRLPRLS
jgi:hypothetical protein